MQVKVIHLDLNPCGGAEHVALVTLKTLINMGAKVELALAKEPDISRIANTSSEDVKWIFSNVRVRPLERLHLEIDRQSSDGVVGHQDETEPRYDLAINTHADILPYLPDSTRHYATYCHFPAAAMHIKNRSRMYLDSLVEMNIIDKDLAKNQRIWDDLLQYYLRMLKASTIVTNSRFSQRAIIEELKTESEHGSKVPMIISPPACIDEIQKAMLPLTARDDTIMVVSRFHPSKRIENAVRLAQILARKRIGTKVIIAGNLTSNTLCRKYYEYLVTLTERYGLSGNVQFRPSIPVAELRRLLQESKAYFHPMGGEPFGISVVEAMAAGTIPVVPDVGGMTEFVPKKYHFKSLAEAAEKIQTAMAATDGERKIISESVCIFTTEAYEKQLALFVSQFFPPSSEDQRNVLRPVPKFPDAKPHRTEDIR